jgi:hypothetical protein
VLRKDSRGYKPITYNVSMFTIILTERREQQGEHVTQHIIVHNEASKDMQYMTPIPSADPRMDSETNPIQLKGIDLEWLKKTSLVQNSAPKHSQHVTHDAIIHQRGEGL